jgi:hypothetical protein
MIELGITPKVVIRRKTQKERCPNLDLSEAASIDDDLVVMEVHSNTKFNQFMDKLDTFGMQLGHDYTFTDLGSVKYPVDWLDPIDPDRWPATYKYREPS